MLLGEYEVTGTLGSGGAGTVFRARRPGKPDVALKVLHKRDDAALARFDRERAMLVALGEPEGFVPLLDWGECAQGPFVVMRLLEGGTLRERLSKGPLAVIETLDLGVALARALGVAHARGVVHRDVKPENILYTKDGRPLIADLGIARHFATTEGEASSLGLSKTGEVRGTAGYMPPEQLEDSKRVTPASDVFALGAVLYECLAGVPVFAGESLVELFAKVDEGKFTPLRELRKDVPSWLEAVIHRALAPAPTDRFEHGAALADALRAGPRGKPPSGWRAVVAALALLLFALAGLAFAVQRSREREEALRRQRGADAAKDARKLLDRGELPLLADLDRTVALSPGSALAWANRAEARLRTNDAESAEPDVARALELDPKLAAAWVAKARLRELAGDDQEALRAVERALALDPEQPGARVGLARWQLRNRQRAEAERSAAQLATQYPRRGDVLHLRALVKKSGADFEGALAELSRALEADPELDEARAEREQLLQLKRDDSEQWREMADLDRTLSLTNGRDAVALARRARLRLCDGYLDPEGAISDASRSLDLDQRPSDAWLYRAAAKTFSGDFEGALTDASEGLARTRTDQRLWFTRSYAHWKLRHLDATIDDATEAIALGEGTWAWATRGLARHAKGERDGAREDLVAGARFALRPLALEEEVRATLARLQEEGR